MKMTEDEKYDLFTSLKEEYKKKKKTIKLIRKN